jgi:hypothetical protein
VVGSVVALVSLSVPDLPGPQPPRHSSAIAADSPRGAK